MSVILRAEDVPDDLAEFFEPVGENDPLTTIWTLPVARSKAAHFAVMPAKLAERCVLAGTSAKGVCPACGEPWRRVVAKKRVPTRPGADTKVTGDRLNDGNRDPQRHVTRVETVGWEPGCGCDAGEPVPSVVLEPFAGSGTTLAVAVEHGRRAVGCDLFEKFAEMARERVMRVTPRLAMEAVTADAPADPPAPAPAWVQPGLFEG